MRKLLLVSALLCPGFLAPGAVGPVHAQAPTPAKTEKPLTDAEKTALLKQKTAAIEKRTQTLIAALQDPTEKAEALAAFESAQLIKNPLARAKSMASLRQILSVTDTAKRRNLLSRYQTPTSAPPPPAPVETAIIDEGERLEDAAPLSPIMGETEIEIQKEAIYSALEGLYVTPNCKALTPAQRAKIEAVDTLTARAKYASAEALLDSYRTQIGDFFANDFARQNCPPPETGEQPQIAKDGGKGMCQLMQALQGLIPAAAETLAGGGTLGDAQAIGQQELAALQQNQSKIDQDEDHKKERARQISTVNQGLAAITKMMGGGQRSGRGSPPNGSLQTAENCGK